MIYDLQSVLNVSLVLHRFVLQLKRDTPLANSKGVVKEQVLF